MSQYPIITSFSNSSLTEFLDKQGLQHRDRDEEGQGERGEALRRRRTPRGPQQDAHRSGTLRAEILQGRLGHVLQ